MAMPRLRLRVASRVIQIDGVTHQDAVRLNRICRSPELVLHGVNCLHQVHDAGLPVLEYIQQADRVTPLLWEHVPEVQELRPQVHLQEPSASSLPAWV
ncbi:MAG: hypothetical protein MHM6MM_000368 [Cercozoa sp. M6MM]